MLRALVALLLLANLGFWVWSTGALTGLGLAPPSERDPARLGQQVRPDAVRVLAPSAAQAALSKVGAVSASRPGTRLQCLEARPFSPAMIEAAERALAAAGLPDGSWVRIRQETKAQFAIVLGPFSSRDALQDRRAEIGRLRLPVEALELPGPVAGAAPQTGLALGRYDTREAADNALVGFSQRGVRSARVVMLRPAGSEDRMRAENATPEQAEQLRSFSAAAFGAGFAPCAASSR
jgi:hypothetical protein